MKLISALAIVILLFCQSQVFAEVPEEINKITLSQKLSAVEKSVTLSVAGNSNDGATSVQNKAAENQNKISGLNDSSLGYYAPNFSSINSLLPTGATPFSGLVLNENAFNLRFDKLTLGFLYSYGNGRTNGTVASGIYDGQINLNSGELIAKYRLFDPAPWRINVIGGLGVVNLDYYIYKTPSAGATSVGHYSGTGFKGRIGAGVSYAVFDGIFVGADVSYIFLNLSLKDAGNLTSILSDMSGYLWRATLGFGF